MRINPSVPTREIILEVLDENRALSLKEIVDRVRTLKEVKPKTIRRQISNLVKIGMVTTKGQRPKKRYVKAEKPISKVALQETQQERLRNLTSSESKALSSVVYGIAPLLIDAEEKVELFDLLGRVHDLDKLLASHNLSDGHYTIARLCLGFFQRYPDIFEVEMGKYSSSPLRAKISVKDPLGLLFVRFKHDDSKISQLLYFKNRQDYYTEKVIESVELQNEMVNEIDKALKDNVYLRYVVRILALKRASPRWFFGYEFENDLQKINMLLEQSGFRFKIESGDRLEIHRTRDFSETKNSARTQEYAEDINILTEEFERFFQHPYRAIMPNPFNKEPELWRHYADSFYEIYHSWFSSFKHRFKKSAKKLDFAKLLQFWTEFLFIIKGYGLYAKAFRAFASTKEQAENIPDHIKEQFNTEFLDAFNHVLLRKIDEYSMKFERASGHKIPDKKMEFIKPIAEKSRKG